MFRFPWFDWDDDISDFEKIDFFAHGPFWGVPSHCAGWFFAAAAFTPLGRKFSKSVVWKKNFWKSFRKTSQLSRNIFWACWDHVVAQKSIFKKKKSEKVANSCNPPPFSYLRDICWLYRFSWSLMKTIKRHHNFTDRCFTKNDFFKKWFFELFFVLYSPSITHFQ